MQAQISACASSIAYCAATELNDETLLIICNLHSEEPPEIGKQSFRALAEEIREELEKQVLALEYGDNMRGSAKYRRHLAGVLLKRCKEQLEVSGV